MLIIKKIEFNHRICHSYLTLLSLYDIYFCDYLVPVFCRLVTLVTLRVQGHTIQYGESN